MRCPLCHNRHVGILSSGRFFCAECAIEILVKEDTVFVYNCDEQGELELLHEVDVGKQAAYSPFSVFLKPQS